MLFSDVPSEISLAFVYCLLIFLVHSRVALRHGDNRSVPPSVWLVRKLIYEIEEKEKFSLTRSKLPETVEACNGRSYQYKLQSIEAAEILYIGSVICLGTKVLALSF